MMWQVIPWDQAACRGRTELFFARDYGRARALCVECPVRFECRAAGREGFEFGIWGGETELARARAGFPTSLGPHIARTLERGSLG